jgi:serine/threonine-protein kinase PRP4
MGQEVIKQISITKPKRDVRARIVPAPSKLKEDELKVSLAFVDLLDKCLTLDPAKRITPKEALNHPFVRG